MPSPTESMALILAPVKGASLSDEDKVQQCIANIREANDTHVSAEKTYIETALVIGANASQARDLLPKDLTFKDWVEGNFGKGRTKNLSIQWIRICINAAKAHRYITKREDKSDCLKRLAGVREMAAALPALEDGTFSLTALPAPAAKGRPAKDAPKSKAKAKAKDAEPADTGEGANDLAEEAQKLAKLAKLLDLKEERLNKFEAELNDRERVLVMREAALGQPGTVSDAKAKDTSAADGERALEATRAKARKAEEARAAKANPKPTSDATSAAKPKAKGSKAKTPKTATTQAAVVAAPEPQPIKTDAMDQPHHGHAPEGDAAQAGEAF